MASRATAVFLPNMKNVSKTSSGRRLARRRRGHAVSGRAKNIQSIDREPCVLWTPHEPRRRKREARLWVEILSAYSTNGRVSERWPGQLSLQVSDSLAIHEAAMNRLEARDPELCEAVRRVQSNEVAEGTARIRMSVAAWKADTASRGRRLSRVRATFRPPGREPSLRAVYWRFLRATEFLTAEVAERQTR